MQPVERVTQSVLALERPGEWKAIKSFVVDEAWDAEAPQTASGLGAIPVVEEEPDRASSQARWVTISQLPGRNDGPAIPVASIEDDLRNGIRCPSLDFGVETNWETWVDILPRSPDRANRVLHPDLVRSYERLAIKRQRNYNPRDGR